MFLDEAIIFCKAGNGGDGCVGFHREKYVNKGGPDGGDGGRGGSIYVQVDPGMTTLIDFRYKQHYRAENGQPGSGKNMFGQKGADLIIKVPRGTVISDAETGGILADAYHADEKILLLAGGRGGRGNARFATPVKRSPAFAENGEKTIERKIKLELKTIADVGLVGFPNVGKSTLLSVISAARPKIADYPFTTLSPNLGVVKHYDDSFVVADIPGLIEGASEGQGLGHKFLRHVERVRLIVHVIDVAGTAGRDPLSDYDVIRKELKSYNERLYNLPEIVVASKCDLLQGEETLTALKEKVGCEVYPISAVTRQGVKELLDAVSQKLKQLPPLAPMEFEKFEYEATDKDSVYIERHDGAFFVTGGYVEELARKAYLDDNDSFNWFQKKMRERGIIEMLRAQGAKDGDTICVLDLAFTFMD